MYTEKIMCGLCNESSPQSACIIDGERLNLQNLLLVNVGSYFVTATNWQSHSLRNHASDAASLRFHAIKYLKPSTPSCYNSKPHPKPTTNFIRCPVVLDSFKSLLVRCDHWDFIIRHYQDINVLYESYRHDPQLHRLPCMSDTVPASGALVLPSLTLHFSRI